ncbi:MAG: ATP-binding protein, partial [Ruminiclostridium sp.]|nr:ATP-binding protein [Ruminiclostridium sp.]
MAKINLLDRSVFELIAAGEVIERPASVIKELVENSIDAGAKHITVEIKDGGSSFMRVTDDGCGISHDEIPTAFLRHATSKVKTADDLDKILTLGFRGEALASVAAVARVEVLTKEAGTEYGSSFKINGG